MPSGIRNAYPKIAAEKPQDKAAVLKTMEYLSLSPRSYLVIGGANLVLREIIETTSDIDMLVSATTFSWLKDRKGATLKSPPLRAQEAGATNQSVVIKNSRTLLPVSATKELGDGYYPMSFETHRHLTNIVAGVTCLNLDEVHNSKVALQRPNDIQHLQAIAAYLGKTVSLPPPTVKRPVEVS